MANARRTETQKVIEYEPEIQQKIGLNIVRAAVQLTVSKVRCAESSEHVRNNLVSKATREELYSYYSRV